MKTYTDTDQLEFQHNDIVTAPNLWVSVQQKLKSKLDESEFEKWISSLNFVAEVDGEILILAETGLQRDRVCEHYQRQITSLWHASDAKKRPVRVVCMSDLSDDVRELATTDRTVQCEISSDQQSFDTLVVGESNRVAVTIGKRIARNETIPSDTVFLYGSHGVGKTHILQAVMAEIQATAPTRKVLFMSAEEFMVAFVDGVKKGDTSGLKNRVRSADLVLIDDLQAITGMKGTQKEFFANIRSVTARGGRVILTADESPSQLQSLSTRVRDQLQGGICVEVGQPDETMRREIIRMKAKMLSSRQSTFELDEAMVERIACRVRGPGRQLCGAVSNIFAATAFVGKDVTFSDVEAALSRQVGERKVPTIDEIKRAAVSAFGLTKAEIESARRARAVAYPRQLAMFMARQMTPKSYPQIGKSFGDRDHTTVLYAVRKVEELLGNDDQVKQDLELIERHLEDIQMNK